MAMEPCSSFSFSFAPTLWGIKNYFSQLHEIVPICTLVAGLNFELSCNKGLVRGITFVFFLCSGLKGILPQLSKFSCPFVWICVCFFGGVWFVEKITYLVCVTHSFLQWHVSRNPIPPHSPPKTNNSFWTKREMIILSNVHLAHVCTCVCVCTQNKKFSFFNDTLQKKQATLFLIAKKEIFIS
jgi:hypothetical protein